MRLLDHLELVVFPAGPLGTLMRAVPDLDGLLGQRAGLTRDEDELDHLPVALVQVVEVVEGVEGPVLERELVRIGRIGRDVGVHGWIRPLREPACPALVVALGLEGVAGEVEVVLMATVEVRGEGADLHEIGGIHGPRSDTVGSSNSRSTSIGPYDSP